VDALVLTPAADAGLEPICSLAREAAIPLVIEANPVEGMRTLVAICDFDPGVKPVRNMLVTILTAATAASRKRNI
jgi:hypothetical protein